MKPKTLTRVLLFSAPLFCTACSSTPQAPSFANNPPGIVGGYSGTAVTPRVQKAADFAVRAQAKKESGSLHLVAVTRAESQVVAGTNYHLVLKVTQAGQSRSAEVVVFESLKARYELAFWRWLSK